MLDQASLPRSRSLFPPLFLLLAHYVWTVPWPDGVHVQYPGIACARHKHGVVDALVHCSALHGRWRAVSLLYLKLKPPSLCFLS